MKRIGVLLIVAVYAFVGFAAAQAPQVYPAAELYLRLKKLNVLGSVLYIAAHPDDENSRLIAYMAKDRLYRTGYLSMTRGDGGQNLIGDEQGVDLGLIRTQEMLAARRIDGAEQFFTRAFDFGFTKTTEEAMRTWDKNKILSDVVWVIRKFQPDVIMTRFPEDARAGHGHHSASAVLAHEAFAAAADPTKFVEQFKYGVMPWKTTRLLWNTFNFGNTNTTSDDQLKIDVGVYNPILGKSYGEIAAESRTQHKSQGAALTPARGQSIEFFTLIGGEPVHTDIMDDINLSWTRVQGGGKIQEMITALIQNFSLTNPEKSVSGLVQLYHAMSDLKDGYWKKQKMKEVQVLIEACSGLWLEATTRVPYAVQGDSVQVNFVFNNRLGANIAIDNIKMTGLDTNYAEKFVGNRNYILVKNIVVGTDEPLTQPYWLRQEMSAGSFNVSDQQLIGDAQSKPALEVAFRLNVEGQQFVFTRPVQYKFTDPVKGELYEPVTILPTVTGTVDPELVLFTDGEEKTFELETKQQGSHTLPSEPTLANTNGLMVKQTSNFHGSRFVYAAKANGPKDAVIVSDMLVGTQSKKDTVRQLKTIAYDHIPRIDYFKVSAEKFVFADVKIAGKRIGYIEGAGDKVPQALTQMGYDVIVLKEKDITAGALAQYDAIITGVRAYDVHEWLNAKYDLLMDYVKDGGNLIVQYNRNNQSGSNKVKIGPYPFTISNARVTDENAAVDFLKPAHPVLNFPNKISSKDFEGWIQERGIYFLGQLDSKYETVLSMHDANEPAQEGSLVIGDYGKGKFVYTGLVFFRELPAGVAGAYRLLANIIALNRKKAF